MKEIKKMTDNQLVLLALEHNTLANTELFYRYQKFIKSFFYKKGIHETDSEDLLMVVYEKIFLKLKTFNHHKGSLKSWISSITNNTIIDYFRATKNKHQTVYITLIDNTENEYSFDFASETTTDSDIISKESIALLYTVIEQLPSKYKVLIELLIEEKNNNEIAILLGSTPNVIGVQKMRALIQLKKLLLTFKIN
jgi:RNA polymerase sigma factor (sigma-70 family)